jgi:ATP-dependent protease Clp ATPase subunit
MNDELDTGNSKKWEPEICDFCKKSRKAVRNLFTGDGIAICDECVIVCLEILLDTSNRKIIEAVKGRVTK